jgi:hypothetical protein
MGRCRRFAGYGAVFLDAACMRLTNLVLAILELLLESSGTFVSELLNSFTGFAPPQVEALRSYTPLP